MRVAIQRDRESLMCRASLAVVVALLMVIIVLAVARGPLGRDRYLVAPYLDLSEPGERGAYYALAC